MSVTIADDRQSVVLEHVSWATFEGLLADLAGPGGRITYDGGRLEIMSPSSKHEQGKKLLARLIEAYTEERGIDLESRGSTTFKRADVLKGLEPDECYYVQHAGAIRGKERLDLSADPPPDLALEVEVSTRVVARLPIYAALGIPELWRYDGRTLTVERLRDAGDYHPVDRSAALPDLPLDEVRRALARGGQESETAIVRAFRARIRELNAR